MKKIILSSDDQAKIYLVPDEVAMNLEQYCWDFSVEWIWKNPNGAKLLKDIGGQKVAVYNAADFIDYLNQWVFPQQQSVLLEQLNHFGDELPEEYRDYPRYNF